MQNKTLFLLTALQRLCPDFLKFPCVGFSYQNWNPPSFIFMHYFNLLKMKDHLYLSLVEWVIEHIWYTFSLWPFKLYIVAVSRVSL